MVVPVSTMLEHISVSVPQTLQDLTVKSVSIGGKGGLRVKGKMKDFDS